MEEYKHQEQALYDREYTASEGKEESRVRKLLLVQSEEDFLTRLQMTSQEARVLEIGCGVRPFIFKIPGDGTLRVCTDISSVGLQKVKESSHQSPKTSFVQIDAEALAFGDNSFDLVVEHETLSTLNKTRALIEMRRVLCSGGRILCKETLGDHPVLKAWRAGRVLLGSQTKFAAQNILSQRDLEQFKEYFEVKELRYYHCLVLGLGPFLRVLPDGIITAIRSALDHLDELLLRIPFMRMFAFKVVFELSPLENSPEG